MIRFICGRAGSGKSTRILEMLRGGGDRIFLIVPEQQAVAWERRCAAELEPAANLRLEVLTFTRLFNRTAREYGGFFTNIAGKASLRLLMWAALNSVRGNLSYYSSVRTEKLVPSLMQTVKELHTYRVTPAVLESAARELAEDGDRAASLLSDKLSDLSVIFSAYEELLHSSFSDSDDMPEHTAKAVSEHLFFAGADVYIDSFYSFTPAQLDMIRAAMRDAENVTVTIPCLPEEKDAPHLSHIRENFMKLSRIAEEYGGAEIERLVENHRASCRRLAVLEENLWNNSAAVSDAKDARDAQSLRIVGCADRYSEACAAAARVSELVHLGERYGSIAVIARSADTLSGITDTVFAAKGIPLYTSRRGRLSDSPAATLVMSALRAVSLGYRREDIIAITKTGLLPLDTEACCLFEKYAETWRLRGRHAFLDDEDWCMNPNGYGAARTDSAAAALEAVNTVRRTLARPLSAFSEVFSGGIAASRDVATALYRLLCDLDIPAGAASLAARLRSLGFETQAAESLRMWDALMQALDTLAQTIPDAAGDAESFTFMMAQIIGATDVGTIPTGIDVVNFGSADMLRLDDVRHVIVLGAVEGEFPASATDGGILSESERIMLEGCGIELAAGGKRAIGEELFWFYKAVCAASESVTVIVPETSGGDVCRPSLGVLRLRELFSDIPEYTFSPNDPEMSAWNERDVRTLAYSAGAGGAAARMIFPEYAEASDASAEQFSRADSDEIFGGRLNLSESAMTAYSSCHYKYFSQFVLRLSEDNIARLNPADAGTFIHAVLEKFFRAVKDRDLPLPEDEERALCDRICETEAERLWDGGARTKRQRYLLRRLRASVGVFIHSLSLEFAQSLFSPWRFEQGVGYSDDSSVPAPTIILPDGWEIRLRGRIDRIDVMRDGGDTYVRVVDYKTSSKEFRLADIYEGINLQLLLYLFTIWKCPPSKFRDALAGDGEIIPAGALYFSARPGEASADDPIPDGEGFVQALADVSRTGIVLSDKRIIEAMDRMISGKYAPVKSDGKGGIKEGTGTADLKKFSELYIDICDVIKKIVEDIAAGHAEAEPKSHGGKSPCNYCAYYPMCRKGERDG